MFQGSLLLLTVLTSAQARGWAWVPGQQAEDGLDVMGNNRILQDDMIPDQKRINNIRKDSIMRTLRSPAEPRSQDIVKRDSNPGWTLEPGEEEAYLEAYEVLQNLLVS